MKITDRYQKQTMLTATICYKCRTLNSHVLQLASPKHTQITPFGVADSTSLGALQPHPEQNGRRPVKQTRAVVWPTDLAGHMSGQAGQGRAPLPHGWSVTTAN